MMNLQSRESIVQNMEDAGCSPDIIANFLVHFERNQKEKQLSLLENHRKQLLSRVHKEEKKIYCLDYLIYEIKNETKKL